MTRNAQHARLLYWSHAWHRAAMHYNALGPRARLPYIDRRVLDVMRRCYTYGTGKPPPAPRR